MSWSCPHAHTFSHAPHSWDFEPPGMNLETPQEINVNVPLRKPHLHSTPVTSQTTPSDKQETSLEKFNYYLK